MAWTIEFDQRALREIKKLDKPVRRRIVNYLKERIAPAEDPRQYGKALTNELKGLWRYRVGHYRIICQIEDEEVTVLILRAGHRRHIYE